MEFQSIEASVLESTASCIVIPAPFAEDDVSPEPKFKVIFLSSTSNVAVFKVVVVPLTVKLPVTAKLPPTVALLILVKFLELSTISVPFNCITPTAFKASPAPSPIVAVPLVVKVPTVVLPSVAFLLLSINSLPPILKPEAVKLKLPELTCILWSWSSDALSLKSIKGLPAVLVISIDPSVVNSILFPSLSATIPLLDVIVLANRYDATRAFVKYKLLEPSDKSSVVAAAILASARAFVKYKLLEPSDKSSVSNPVKFLVPKSARPPI